MFYQNLNRSKQQNNRINSLPSVAGASLRAVARNAARYALMYTIFAVQWYS
jgi:streptomycin 6-kinase